MQNMKVDVLEVILVHSEDRDRHSHLIDGTLVFSRDMETEEDAAPCRTELDNVKKGPEGVPEDVLPVLLLFCAAYSHILVVLDDEEFYNPQVAGQLVQYGSICLSVLPCDISKFAETSNASSSFLFLYMVGVTPFHFGFFMFLEFIMYVVA